MRTWITSRPGHAGLVGLVVAGLTVVGCGEKPEPPPVAYMGPTLAAGTLDLGAPPPPANGYTLLEEKPSCGRFPDALAIARLVPPDGVFGADHAPPWRVGTIGFEEALAWNSLGNTMPAVREIIVLDESSTVYPTAELDQIAGAARRLEAALCLVYGPSPAQADHAGLWGVILDTHTGRQLATVHAQAGPADLQPPRADRLEQDMRHRDPNYLVATAFRDQVRRCLLALVERDRPPAATQPNPWQTRTPRETSVYLLPARPLPAR